MGCKFFDIAVDCNVSVICEAYKYNRGTRVSQITADLFSNKERYI